MSIFGACAFGLLQLFGATAAEQTAAYTLEQALQTFQHDPAVRIELVASEPLVFDPVALCFDAKGRLFVVENRGYPTDVEPPRGDVVLLNDADGDGRMDTRTVFAGGFDFPNGLMAWKNGILLTCAPDVLYLEDSDGDGHADVRETVLTGFAPGGSTQLRTSHPTLNLDGWIYFTNGLSGGNVRLPGTPEGKAVKMGAMDLRWNPWDNRIETTAGQAQFGQAFDDMGNKFVCSNRKHIVQVMLQPGDLARNPGLTQTSCVAEIPDHEEAAKLFPVSNNITTAYSHTGTFTAACGLAIYRGSAMGPAFYGNAFVCDPTGNLIHRDILEATGAAYSARRAYPDREFLASPDNWFRPVFLTNGPDGALYVCDMYRKTIEHPVYLPPEIAAKTDFQSGRDMGRIYRIVAADAPHYAPPATIDPADEDALIANLHADDGWKRDTAFRLLLERRPPDLEKRARALLKEHSPFARMYSFWLLYALNTFDDYEPKQLAQDEDPRVRATAVAVRDVRLPLPAPQLKKLLADADPRVRYLAALTAGNLPAPELARPLARLLLQESSNPWMLTALLSSACLGGQYPVEVAQAVAQTLNTHPTPVTPALLEIVECLGRCVVHRANGDDTMFPYVGFIREILTPKLSLDQTWRLAGMLGVLEEKNVDVTQLNRPISPYEYVYSRNVFGGAIDLVTDYAKQLAVDPNAPQSEHLIAIRLLAYMPYDVMSPLLTNLVAPTETEDIQTAALQALLAQKDPRVGDFVTRPDVWNQCSKGTRAVIKAAVFNKLDWFGMLLRGIERGEISPYTLDPAARAQAQEAGDPALAQLAHDLFAKLGGGNREKLFDEYKDLLQLAGNRDAGHAVFTNTCAQCHVFQGEGHKVGPELSDIRAQTPDYILLHLLDPNKTVTAGFESYTVTTKSLETFSGILAAEDENAVTLRQALGVEQRIERKDIDTLSTENRSLMPEELEKSLSRQQIRDLIAFLKGENN